MGSDAEYHAKLEVELKESCRGRDDWRNLGSQGHQKNTANKMKSPDQDSRGLIDQGIYKSLTSFLYVYVMAE